MDSTKDSASESSAASYHRIRLAWSGGDDKYRVNINLRSQKVVKDLIVQLEDEFLEGKAIESLFVVDSEGEKLKLKNTQALEGLFEPSDSLFAQVAQNNVQVQVEETAPTAPAALVFTWPAAPLVAPSSPGSPFVFTGSPSKSTVLPPPPPTTTTTSTPPAALVSQLFDESAPLVLIPPAPQRFLSTSPGEITVFVNVALRGSHQVKVVLPKRATLLTLKQKVCESVGIAFTPDLDEDQAERGITSELVEFTLRTGPGEDEHHNVMLQAGEPLSSLRSLVAEACNPQLLAGDVHYVLINGVRNVECGPRPKLSLSTRPETTIQELKASMNEGDSLHLCGPGVNTTFFTWLESYEVHVEATAGSEFALCLMSAGTDVVLIGNPLLAHQTSEGLHTLLTLKKLVFKKFLSHVPEEAGVGPEDLVVELTRTGSAPATPAAPAVPTTTTDPTSTPAPAPDAALLLPRLLENNDAALDKSGVGSRATVTVSCPKLEAWASSALKDLDFSCSFVGGATKQTKKVPVLPTDSVAVLKYRLHNTIQAQRQGDFKASDYTISDVLSGIVQEDSIIMANILTRFALTSVTPTVNASIASSQSSTSGRSGNSRRRMNDDDSSTPGSSGTERVAIVLALESHVLHSTPSSDRRPLEDWGIVDTSICWASFYVTNSPLSALDGLSPAYGKQGNFSANNTWRSLVLRGGVRVRHSDAGLASLLSCLYLLSSHLAAYENAEDAADVYKYLLDKLPPPAVVSLHSLMSGNRVSAAHVAFLSQGLFALTRVMVSECDGAPVADQELFLHTRFVLNHAFKNARAVSARNFLAKGEQEEALDEDDEEEDEEEEGGANRRSSSSSPLQHADFADLSSALNDAASTATISSAMLELANPGATSCTVLKRCAWPSVKDEQLKQAGGSTVGADGDDEIFAGLTTIEKAHRARAFLHPLFVVMPPLALRTARPPKLTRDLLGLLAVYTGKGKGESGDLNIFRPLMGCEDCTSEKDLAKALKDSRREEELDEQLKPDEVTVCLVDTSGSMGSASNFPKDVVVEFIDKDTHDHWEWAPAASSSSSASASAPPLQLLTKKPYFAELQRLAKTYGAELVLRELCMLENWERPRESDLFEALSRYLQDFLLLLTDDDAALAGSGDNSQALTDIEDYIPKEFLCPISHELMQDPVRAADGQTYERANIKKWFDVRVTSPLHGTKMPSNSKVLVPNAELKQRIKTWTTQGAGDAPASVESTTEVAEAAAEGSPAPTVTVLTVPVRVDLFGSTLPDGVPQAFSITIDSDATVATLQRKILHATNCKIVPNKMAFAGHQLRTKQSLQGLPATLKNQGVTAAKISNDGAVLVVQVFASSAPVTVTVEDRAWGRLVLSAPRQLTVTHLHLRLWLAKPSLQPSNCLLWDSDRWKDQGDNIRLGHPLTVPGQTLAQYIQYREDSKDEDEDEDEEDEEDEYEDEDEDEDEDDSSDGRLNENELNLEVNQRLTRKKKANRTLTRMDAVKQLFHAFCNRTEAYDLQHHVSLITFGSEVVEVCNFTGSFDKFKNSLDDVDTEGDTCLLDAIEKAQRNLDKYAKKLQLGPECRKRIIVLSDGDDNLSNSAPLELCRKLTRSGITLDAIFIDRPEHARFYSAHHIAAATGGYVFCPQTLEEALHLFELETLLSTAQRDASLRRPVTVSTASALESLSARPWDSSENCTRAPEPNLKLRVQSLASFLSGGAATGLVPPTTSSSASSSVSRSPSSTKRIMAEMRSLMKCPHPDVDIFPTSTDIGFWRCVVQGPKDTPYATGCWLFWVKFPESYPAQAPVVRFVTPIRHCNINSQGRVCHSIFAQNWTEATTVKLVFDCIAGLLLSPDVDDPLDSILALDRADDSGLYEANIVKHCKIHAAKTSRDEWKERLSAQGNSFDENIDKVLGLCQRTVAAIRSQLEAGPAALCAIVDLMLLCEAATTSPPPQGEAEAAVAAGAVDEGSMTELDRGLAAIKRAKSIVLGACDANEAELLGPHLSTPPTANVVSMVNQRASILALHDHKLRFLAALLQASRTEEEGAGECQFAIAEANKAVPKDLLPKPAEEMSSALFMLLEAQQLQRLENFRAAETRLGDLDKARNRWTKTEGWVPLAPLPTGFAEGVAAIAATLRSENKP